MLLETNLTIDPIEPTLDVQINYDIGKYARYIHLCIEGLIHIYAECKHDFTRVTMLSHLSGM